VTGDQALKKVRSAFEAFQLAVDEHSLTDEKMGPLALKILEVLCEDHELVAALAPTSVKVVFKRMFTEYSDGIYSAAHQLKQEGDYLKEVAAELPDEHTRVEDVFTDEELLDRWRETIRKGLNLN